MESLKVFAAWSDFYVIVGSAAAALTGLQFVVIVLSTELRISAGPAVQAFATPTVVHFCSVLVLSATMTAPWAPAAIAAILSVWGAGGVIYALFIARRARRQSDYVPVFEDWMFHLALPLAGYLAVAGGGVLLRSHPEVATDTVGGASLLMLVVGIHNAWDAVTYMAHRGHEHRS